MIINKNQLYEISSLIQEGLLVQKSATEAKKKYLGKVKSTIVSLCNDNHEILPSWVETMDIPVLSLSEANVEIVPSFPDIYIITTIELLKDIRSEYYTKENLIELQKQLLESQKQTSYARRAFIVSLFALLATIFIPLLKECFCK